MKDRDQRETIKPPAGVQAQIASGKIPREDPTPVGPIPKPASELAPERPVDSRAQVGDLDALKAHVESRIGEVASTMSTSIAEVDRRVTILADGHEELRDKVEGVSTEIGGVRSQNDDQSRAIGSLSQTMITVASEAREARIVSTTIATDVKAIRRHQSRLRTARAEAQITDELEARKQARSFKWYALRGLVGVVIAAATAGATLLVEHALR